MHGCGILAKVSQRDTNSHDGITEKSRFSSRCSRKLICDLDILLVCGSEHQRDKPFLLTIVSYLKK